MSLKYANLCTTCHKRKTQHPSGVCSECRRSTNERYCKICGTRKTTSPTGLCSVCLPRRNAKTKLTEDRLENAINDTKLTLYILEHRQAGESFEQIGKGCGLTKSACYMRLMAACERPLIPRVAVDYVDDSVISINHEASDNDDGDQNQ